ncbi:hypothetical protein DITRI_Ditri04bG0190200 [Diplodiscus trichospermus]
MLVKLYAAQGKISSLADMTQSKTIAKISELRQANGDLSKEVERLQKSRFDMVEQLVYQRWLNACLKAEIRYHQTPSKKTMDKELLMASEQKTRKITTQYPDMNSTSSYTSLTDSEEIDSCTIDSSSSSQRSISKIFEPDGTSSKKNVSVLKDFTENIDTPIITKARRVSFNDAVETVDFAGLKHEFPSTEVSLGKPDQSTDSSIRYYEDDRDAQEVSKIANARPEGQLHSSSSNVVPNENKMDTPIKPSAFSFFLFLFVLLLYFLHLSAKIYWFRPVNEAA